MKTPIIISLETLIHSSISPDEYVFLYLLFYQQKEKIETLSLKVDLDKLQKQKFIKRVSNDVYARYYKIETLFPKDSLYFTEEPKNVKLEIEATVKKEKKEIENNIEKYWNLLLKTYPKKDNGRVLQNKSVAKPKFLKALEIDSIDNIIKGLKNENAARQNAKGYGKFFPAPKALSTWLNQHVWKDYLDEDVPENESFNKVENL